MTDPTVTYAIDDTTEPSGNLAEALARLLVDIDQRQSLSEEPRDDAIPD